MKLPNHAAFRICNNPWLYDQFIFGKNIRAKQCRNNLFKKLILDIHIFKKMVLDLHLKPKQVLAQKG
jgi:hypothetical protein